MFWKQAWAFAHGSPCGSSRWHEKRQPHGGHHGPHHHGPHHHGPHDHGPHHHGPHQSHSRGGGGGPWGGGAWGVRRPLRFMARQLDLDEEQVAKLAAILDDLKTQRAQLRVDRRKAVSVFADAFLEPEFDAEQVRGACAARADSERLVEEAVAKALERTFALLDPEQRKRLAYLLRSDGLSI